jgi:hypothetical protein
MYCTPHADPFPEASEKLLYNRGAARYSDDAEVKHDHLYDSLEYSEVALRTKSSSSAGKSSLTSTLSLRLVHCPLLFAERGCLHFDVYGTTLGFPACGSPT